jgi:hypothetical protein
MKETFVCLGFSCIHLTEEVISHCMKTAYEMLQSGERNRQLKLGDKLEGILTTNFEETCLVSMTGTHFRAEVETDLGSGHLSFIMRNVTRAFQPSKKAVERHMYN